MNVVRLSGSRPMMIAKEVALLNHNTSKHTNKNVLEKTNEAKTTLGLFPNALYSLYLI